MPRMPEHEDPRAEKSVTGAFLGHFFGAMVPVFLMSLFLVSIIPGIIAIIIDVATMKYFQVFLLFEDKYYDSSNIKYFAFVIFWVTVFISTAIGWSEARAQRKWEQKNKS